MKSIDIGKYRITNEGPVFVVAEVSCNHMGSYENAVAILKAAAEAGADAVKLQTYTADTMTIDAPQDHFKVKGEDNPESWQGLTLYKLYQEAHTPWEWQPKLKKLADELDIVLFSSPFDQTAVDFLEKEINPPCHKIASYELTDDTLLEAVAKTRKPIIISNGYATFEELEHALEVLRGWGANNVVVLYCVTEYEDAPTSSNVNLSTMTDIRDKFDVVVGLSDNNGGIKLPLMAALYGAVVIEKHLMLQKGDKTFDERFSVVPEELTEMVGKIREVEKMNKEEKKRLLKEMDPERSWYGTPVYGPISDLEKTNTHLRRSLFVVKDVHKGEKLTSGNVRSIRPQVGIQPRHYYKIIGKKASTDIERGTPLAWEHISK